MSRLGDETIMGKSAIPKVIPGEGRYKITGSFNPENTVPYNKHENGTLNGLSVLFSIKVEKVNY